MENKQLEIIQSVAMMFKAAPGAHYLSEFVAWINTTGGSVKDLAVSLAQTDVFKQALYADTLSNHEFSMQFIENSVGSLVNDENKAWAVSEIERMLDTGTSRGEVIYWAAMALASVDQNDANWGAAAHQFSNQTAVAAFYSIDQVGSATSLDVLQRVMANVTPDNASVTATQILLTSNAGKVIDGYVKDAQVFADLNGDGLLNPGEARSITDTLGNFSLPGITGFGNLIASGGIDAATGKPFEGSMTAPAGATVINPLTTLIDGIAQNSAMPVQDAAAKLLSLLNLDPSIDLLHFDPIKEAIRTDTDSTATDIALAIHVAAVQIQILTSQTAALLCGAGISPDETAAIDLVYNTIAASLASTTGPVDLTSKDAIAYVIQEAAARSGADSATVLKAGVLLADAAQTIANLNQAVTDKSTSSTNESKVLSSIAAVQIVAENIEAAMKSGAAKGSVGGTVISTTGSLFANTITAAGSKVGDVTGDGKPDPLPGPPSSGGGSAPPLPTDKYFLATNATAFSGTAGDDILSISTATTWTPLVMTAVVLDGGAGTNTLSVQDGSSIAAAIVTNFTNLSFDATGVVGTNNVTMSATQNQNFTGTITASGTGVNGEEITIFGNGAVTTLANVENYSIGDDSTNARTVTITNADVNVTADSASNAITFNLGTPAFTGTISGDNTVAETLSLSTGADISGGTITNVTALNLASGATVQLSAAQNQGFSGAVTAPGTGINGEIITIVGDGAVTTLANVENYSIGDDSTNARTVTMTNADVNVTADSVTDAVTFSLGALVYSGTISGDNTVADTLNLSTGADISGGMIADVATLNLVSGASVRLSVAQNQGFSGAVAAPGTGVNGETIIIAGDGAVTTLANVENYALEDDSTNARIVTIADATTNVTADSASDAMTFNVGALSFAGTITSESTVADTLSLSTGADISGGTVNNVAALVLASGAAVRLSVLQNQGFSGAVTASGTGVNGEAITIVGDGTVTTLAGIENYELEDDSTNARSVTITNADVDVTADSVTDAVTFNVGALNFTGTINGDNTVADTLSLSDGADISGGTINNVAALNLASGAAVQLSAAQNQGFSGTVTAPGTGVNGETIIIVGDGAVTTLANVENYSIDDDSTNARTVTIANASVNAAADSASDAITFNLGTLAFTGTISGDNTVEDTLSLSDGADISGGTINNVAALNLASGAAVRLSVVQNQGFSGAVTAPGTGVNGETITIVGDGAVTTLANIEAYELEDDSTNARTVTIADATTNVTVTSVTDAVTFNVGTLNFTGTITGDMTVADTLSLSTGADISGGTIANVAALNLASGASVRFSVAQNQGFSGAVTAPGTGVNGETITIAGDGAVTTLANVENYALEDDSTNVRTVTIADASVNVTADSVSDAITFNLGTLAFTGTINGDNTVADTLGLSDGADISGGTVNNVAALNLASGAAVQLSAAQNQGFSGTVTAPGTGVNGETITIVGDGAVTTLANIENYSIGDDSSNARTVTIADATTNVTADSVTDAVTFNVGTLSFTGTITGDSTVADMLNLSTGADISDGTIADVAALNLASGAAVRLSVAQNQGFSGAVTAPGTGVNGETITIAGDGAVTTLANVENYALEDDSTNARTVTIASADVNVTADSVTDAITFNLGTLAFTGTISGDNTVADTLSLSDGADISGGTIVNVTALNLASGAAVRLSALQNQGFSGAVTAPGTGVNGETITIAGDGAVTTLANVENYALEDDSTNARTVTIADATTNVTANSASDAITFNLGTLAFTGTINGDNTVADTLGLSDSADISGGTITNVTALNLASGAAVRLSVAQNQGFSGNITAPGVGVNGETAIIAGDGAVTTLANVENYELDDDTTNARTVTTGSTALNLIADNASDTVTVNAAALAQNAALTVAAASASAMVINNLVGDVIASNLSGSLAVTTANAADNGIAITTGSAATAVNVAAGAASDTVTIDTAALTNNTALTVTAAGGAAGIVNVTGLTGNLTVSNPASGTIGIAVADNTVDDGIAITAGAASLAITGVADGDTVTVTGFTGSTLTGAIAGSTGKFNITVGTATSNITTGAGDDSFTFVAGTGLTSADTVDGGAGTDTVILTGNTAVAVTNFNNVRNIEAITLANTNTAVAITTQDTLVAAGAILTLQATSLTTGVLTFNGAAETDGAFNITGGGANDAITGGSGNDTLTGGNGNDSITAGLGNDTLTGGAGNDTFTFATATGLTSADVLDGGAGTDTVVLTGNTAFTATDEFDNVQDIEAITLSNTDTAVTFVTQDALVAAGATLTLSNAANLGVLTFNGSAETNGNFTITGGSGNDNITSGAVNNTLVGNAGDDTFTFVAGTGLTTDTVNGGIGIDTVILTGTTAVTATQFNNVSNIEAITLPDMVNTAVTITTVNALVAAGATLTLSNAANAGILTFNGAAEADGTFNITGGSGNDSITGGSGNDTLTGGDGNDSVTAGLGNDTLSGDAGNDTLRFAAVTGLTTADMVDGGAGTDTVALTGNTAFTAATDFDNVRNIEAITLGNTNTAVTITTQDTLVAAGATLTLSTATTGGLVFNGAAETDGAFSITSSGASNDTITGGTGADSMVCGTGTDVVSGGANNDTFSFAAGSGLTTADSVNGGTGTDTVALTGNTAVAATNFDNVSNIETITVANTTGAVAITAKDALVAAGAVLTLQATSLTSGVLTFNGSAETDGTFNITGGGGNDAITGGSGNDTLTGGNGNDSITAGLGNDTLTGGAGNDTFAFIAATGLTTADVVDGGAGTDTVALTGNAAFSATNDFDNIQNIETITLGNTNTAVTMTTLDTLVAAGATLTLSNAANSGVLTFNGSAETDGNFTITGGSGNDVIISGAGNNTLTGGAGDDTFTFVAGTGLTTDTINGGTGIDTVILTGTAAVTATQFNNVSNIEAITLPDMVNTAVTVTTVNALVAAGATLTLSNAANSGVLTFNGAAETNGTFNITGGSGNDSITGGSGNDTLAGGSGSDSMTAGLGNDTLSGDADNDTFTLVAGTGLTSADSVDGGAGTDIVALTGNTAVAATNFNNVRNIETITLVNTTTNVAITTPDTLVAAGAILTLQATSLTTGVLTFNGAAETDGTFNITGGGANDAITGGSGNDSLTGGNGNDSITAGLGNDTLSGGAGNDTLRFAAVTGLASADVVDGGAGTDTIALTGNTAFTAANDFDNVENIEAITLGNTNTAVTMTTQNTLVAAGATLTLSNAANSEVLTFNGNAETDGVFTITGGTGNDSITGGSGNDTISGGTGNDTLVGGAGNDSMTSGAGNDSITGGAGADTIPLGSSANDNTRQTVIYSTASDGAAAGANSGADSITQFDANANTAADDLIQVSGALKTLLDDDSDGTLDYSTSNSADLGNQAIVGGTNQEATVLLDAEIELVLADFTTAGLTNVLTELGEEIDFTGIATGEEHLFVINFSATQTAMVLYTAGSGGDDTIVATDIQVLGIVTHNDGTGLVAGNVTF